MNSKQSFVRSTLTFILLATFLGTTICHAAIKPSINQKALAQWQRKVARSTWEKLQKIQSLSQIDIDTIIGQNKPTSTEFIIAPVSTATSKAQQEEQALYTYVTNALQAFMDAQNIQARSKEDFTKEMNKCLERFSDNFSKLNDEKITELAQILTAALLDQLQKLKDVDYQPDIKYCDDFLDKINLIFTQKFRTQLQAAQKHIATIKETEDSKKDLTTQINEQKKQLVLFDKKIVSTKNLIHGKMQKLLFGWKERDQSKLIDIATDPEFTKRLDAPETSEICRKKWDEIKDDPQLTELFRTRKELIFKQQRVEEELARLQQELERQDQSWLEASYGLQEIKEKLQKKPVYAALNALIAMLKESIQALKDIEPQIAQRAATKSSSVIRQGSTMAIPPHRISTSKQKEQATEEEGQSWKTEGFTWQASRSVLEGIKK